MDRRQFTKRTALTLAVAGLASSAFKCGSEQVSIYIHTISTFLNQVAGVLPAHAQTIARIVKVATDFDSAYQRGDFASADKLFNSLEQNLTQLTNDLGLNVSNNVKTWIAIVGAALTSIAVLLKDQAQAQPKKALTAVALESSMSAGAVERLASQAAVDQLYQTAKPKQ